jgi:hypothetical protein
VKQSYTAETQRPQRYAELKNQILRGAVDNTQLPFYPWHSIS